MAGGVTGQPAPEGRPSADSATANRGSRRVQPIETVPEPIVVFAPLRDASGAVVDLQFRYANAAALLLAGRDRDSLVGRTLFDLFPGLRGNLLWPRTVDVIETGTDLSAELFDIDEAGVAGTFECNLSPYDGGLIVTLREITDRRRMEAELRRERDLFDSTLATAGALIVVVDADWRVVRLNRQTELSTGYREADMLGEHYDFLFPPSERAEVARVLTQMPTDHPVDQVNHYVTRSGELRLMRWSYASLLDADGNRTHVVGVGIDITEQDAAERALAERAAELEAANQELARSNTDLDQFASVASHDLREPLRAISASITLLAQRCEEYGDDDARQLITFATRGCERMQRMIEGLLAFSRVGRADGAPVSTDSAAVVRQALDALKPALDASGAVVDLGPLPLVRAEPGQLSQVFQNLIGNAVKFVAPGVVPRVRIAATAAEDFWRFEVVDNGIGIPATLRDRVFMMFKRLHVDDDYAGTGVGLAVVKKIVERHGGSIGIEDVPDGTGCRFWFTLPAAD